MTIKIADLTSSKVLDRAAMAEVTGGYAELLSPLPLVGGFLSVLSPHIENDRQLNSLAQLNEQAIANVDGVVFNVPIQAAAQSNFS